MASEAAARKALEVAGVTKRFGAVTAVDEITFSVPQGRITCLLGPSGCGKTTSLRLIAGFEFPDSGVISIGGATMSRERPYERKVGLLFQDYALFPHMTVHENVCYGLKHRRYPKAAIQNRSRAVLELVKLRGLEQRYPSQLSGGQQQRVALARALAPEPDILLLDEPLSALDAKLRDELRVELKDILDKVDCTTIVVTHDQEEAMSLGNSIIVMNEGRIEQEGSPSEIYARPANRFVADFVGRSNWLRGVVLDAGPMEGFVWVELGNGAKVRSRCPAAPAGSACDLFVRPEAFTVASAADRGSKETLTGRVHDVSPLGSDVHVTVDVEGVGRVVVVRKNQWGDRLQRGDHVTLAFEAADSLVFALDR
jgi:putative spermidine/putrescine transport system ATP-binding protein/putrescine transport system ATP-binding protein